MVRLLSLKCLGLLLCAIFIIALSVDAQGAVKKDGTIFDVLQGTPAWEAGIGPNMVILAVDGRVYSPDVLNESIAHPWNGKIALQVRNFNSIETYEIRYGGGVRYPHLERIPEKHDYLSEMLGPRVYKEH